MSVKWSGRAINLRWSTGGIKHFVQVLLRWDKPLRCVVTYISRCPLTARPACTVDYRQWGISTEGCWRTREVGTQEQVA